jgi:hypothetical protein
MSREVVEENKLWLIFGNSICGFEGMYRFKGTVG